MAAEAFVDCDEDGCVGVVDAEAEEGSGRALQQRKCCSQCVSNLLSGQSLYRCFQSCDPSPFCRSSSNPCTQFSNSAAKGIASTACGYVREQCRPNFAPQAAAFLGPLVCYLVQLNTCIDRSEGLYWPTCGGEGRGGYGRCSQNEFYGYFKESVRDTCRKVSKRVLQGGS